jgi:hypothetical protein
MAKKTKTYSVTITYMATAVVEVEAKSVEEAIAKVEANDDNYDRNGWVQEGDYCDITENDVEEI